MIKPRKEIRRKNNYMATCECDYWVMAKKCKKNTHNLLEEVIHSVKQTEILTY